MQSQQKKVKWSRGETADALEERTDTGITQVSVSKMENIISDIYGNISRRPALKIIDSVAGATDIPVISGISNISNSSFVRTPQSFVFTIDENTYIIFISDQFNAFGGLLIHNDKFVRRVTIANNTGYSVNHLWEDKISVAQNNNWMVVSNLYTYDVVFKLTGTNLTNYAITVDKFQFSAPWYAPNGTQTKQVTSSEISGLSFDSASIGQYTYTEANGETTVYSWIKTGLASSSITCTWSGQTTTYYLCSTDGGNSMFITTTQQGTTYASWTMTNGNTYTNSQTLATVTSLNLPVKLYLYESRGYFNYLGLAQLDVSSNINIPQIPISVVIPAGSIVQFPNNGAYMRVEGYDSDGANLRMYGAFLTPVANNNTTDTIVKVETGYVSLQDYQPLSFAFSNQRLYASNFYNGNATQKLIPGYAVGSQIGRYTDFKNDYNLQSEAVIIDINTKYQEKITALIDYNGLKILTDAAEYAYINSGVVKQSENGSLALCEPLVFGSVCLYPDKSGGQIRAIQYELHTDLFNSSSINEMTQEDLIFATYSMGGFIDKEHCTGHFLYTVQSGYKESGIDWGNPIANHSMAVCNFVPANQVVNWSRWTTPDMIIGGYNRHTVSNVIEVNNKVWFIINCIHMYNGSARSGYTLAELDYENRLDFESTQDPSATVFSILPQLHAHNLYAWVDGANVVYTMTDNVLEGDPIYNASEQQIATAENSPGGPNIIIDGVGYYEWQVVGGPFKVYSKQIIPTPTGPNDDPSRYLYDEQGNLLTRAFVAGYNTQWNQLMVGFINPVIPSIIQVDTYERNYTAVYLQYTLNGTTHQGTYDSTQNLYAENVTIPGIISIFDGDTYMWNDMTDEAGNFTRPLSELTNPRVGFMINAILESHPIDIQGKTYTEKKRIGKAVAVIRDTEPGTFTVCDKSGYTSPDKKTVNFYGCTGMKDKVQYTIKNIQGAKFTIESLTMIIEHGTLDS